MFLLFYSGSLRTAAAPCATARACVSRLTLTLDGPRNSVALGSCAIGPLGDQAVGQTPQFRRRRLVVVLALDSYPRRFHLHADV